MFGFVAGISLIASVAGAEPPSTYASTMQYTAIVEDLDEETLKGLSNWYADRYGQDSKLGKEIIECESGWNPEAKNPNSTAKGLFQILNGTWEDFECPGDVLNAYDNLNCGYKILKEGGKQHWEQCL